MENNSNIVFLEKSNNEWTEKLSDLPHKWFTELLKKSDSLVNQFKNNFFKIENQVLYNCREREKALQINSKNSIDL